MKSQLVYRVYGNGAPCRFETKQSLNPRLTFALHNSIGITGSTVNMTLLPSTGNSTGKPHLANLGFSSNADDLGLILSLDYLNGIGYMMIRY